MDEVLQYPQVYTDVSKGEVASKKDLKEFGKMSHDEVMIEILNKGELQVSELERNEQLENLKKQIAGIIAQKCVSTTDSKQFPVSIIIKAMNDSHCQINPKQDAKK